MIGKASNIGIPDNGAERILDWSAVWGYDYKSFRTKLWLYFILFTAIIFTMLWLLRTVFLQNFYDRMLEKRTFSAIEQMAAGSANESFTDMVDTLADENSLLVFVGVCWE